MLKKIPYNLSSDLVKILMDMGHGDEIVIADGNFPARACAQRLIQSPGNGVNSILRSILELFPVDTYVEQPIYLMQHGPEVEIPEIWGDFEQTIKNSGEQFNVNYLDRYTFYDQAKKAFAIISTSDQQLYANIILKKGVINKE